MRLDLATVYAYVLTTEEALDEMEFLVVRGKHGDVVTPDVDAVVQAEDSEALR